MLAGALLPETKRRYPYAPTFAKDVEYGDDFSRSTLTPTGSATLYTVGATGGGTGTIPSSLNYRVLEVLTGATIGDETDVWTSAFAFRRGGNPSTAFMFNNVNSILFETYFQLGQTATTEAFVGLIAAQATITAMPTTARHIGIQFDASANANFFTTSSNGTTQVTEDTTQAANTSAFRMRIRYTGNNAATIELASVAGNVIYTDTVTALGNGDEFPWSPHFFCQTEAGAAKTLYGLSWRVLPT